MAKIQAIFDSETKELEITVDGVKQEKACCFNCYSHMYENGGIEGSCSIDFETIEENGMKHRHSAYANKDPKEQLKDYTYSILNKSN